MCDHIVHLQAAAHAGPALEASGGLDRHDGYKKAFIRRKN